MAQIFKEYNCNDDNLRVLSVEMMCVCCLAQDVPLIHLVTCKHNTFLEFYFKFKMDIQDCLICYMCHGILRKIDQFIQQINKSLDVMNEKVSKEQSHYFQTTQVKILSVDPELEDMLSQSESGSKEYQEIGVRDDNLMELEQFERRNDLDESDVDGLQPISSSCLLDTYNHSSPEDNSKIDFNSETIKLKSNTTELNIICPDENCQHPDESHTHYVNNEAEIYNDNDNGYDDVYDSNRYEEYFENGTKPQEQVDNYDEHINNDTMNDNDHTTYDNGTDVKDTEKERKKKKVKKPRSGFKKIILSVEEQKAELEAKRKGKKYLDAEFKCYNCAMGFLFKDTYQAHMMRHEESNGEYKCNTCTLRFASVSVLRAHRQLHGVRARCLRCRVLLHVRDKRTHAANCAGDATTPCHLCARVFRDASGLQQHIKRFHLSKTSLRTYSCSVCGKSYNNQAAVRTHMIKHLNRKFPCENCSATFSSPYTLNQHKKRHTSTPELHYCEICKIGYNSRKSLLAHRRNALVHQQTVFECPVCARICPNQRSLTSHMSTVHSTSKDHVCECGARYTSRKSLVRHRATHTRVKVQEVHACHRCPSTFKSRSKLNRHLRQVCEKDKLEEELSCYYEQAI